MVVLRKRKNESGTVSLRLDINHNGKRWVETLNHLRLNKPVTPIDREHNKLKLEQAKAIAVARAAELEAGNYKVVSKLAKETVMTAWMQSYVDSYTKKDKRNMQGALNRFKDFLSAQKKGKLTFSELTPLLIEDFLEYLNERSTGEGASSYYNRFKKMLKHAYRKNLLADNPFEKVETKPKGKAAKKDVLTLEEITLLANTPIQSNEVKRAFLFSCMTGLRWIDVKNLKWKHIKGNNLDLRQSKTGEDLSQPLNDTAMKLLGEAGNAASNVFDLPTANGANKTIKAWVKRAGIDKKITWHNARHSAGTNMILTGTDVVTASKLLGHTTLKHTQRYVDTARELKEAATSKLNINI